MKKRKSLGFERLENRRLLAADLGCDMAQMIDVQPEVEACIVAPEIAEDAANDTTFDLGDVDSVAGGTGNEPAAESAATIDGVDAQLDLADGMDGFFGTLNAENNSDTLSFTPSADGLVEVVVASSFGDASTQLEIRDDSGNLITASETEGLDGFQTVSFAGNAGQVYELKISTDAGVSGGFQVTVGVEPNASSDTVGDNLSAEEVDSAVDNESDDELEQETDSSDDSELAPEADIESPVDGIVEDDSTAIADPVVDDSAQDIDEGTNEGTNDEINDEIGENIDEEFEVTEDATNETAEDEITDVIADEPSDDFAENVTDETSDDLTDEVSNDQETLARIIDSVVDTIVDEFKEAGFDVGEFDFDFQLELPPSDPASDEATAENLVDQQETIEEIANDDVVVTEDAIATDETTADETTAGEIAADETSADEASADETSTEEGTESEEETDLAAEAEQQPADQPADEIVEEVTELNFVGGSAELTGELETVDDTDIFKITAEADGRVTLFVEEPSGENDLNIAVVDSEGNPVVDGATNEAVQIGFEAVAGAEYFVTIGSDADQFGTYSILAEAPVASSQTADAEIDEDSTDSDDGAGLTDIAATPTTPADDSNSVESESSEQVALDDYFSEGDFEWEFSFDGEQFSGRLSRG